MASEKHPIDVEGDATTFVDGEKPATSLPQANKKAQQVLAHSHDADEAMKAFESGEIIELDEATNKRLLRTIDLHMLPLMCVVYGLNYLDKTTLSYASIMGIKKDIGLVGDNYQWLGKWCFCSCFRYPVSDLYLKGRCSILATLDGSIRPTGCCRSCHWANIVPLILSCGGRKSIRFS
jgi:hypothetical protein